MAMIVSTEPTTPTTIAIVSSVERRLSEQFCGCDVVDVVEGEGAQDESAIVDHWC